jgi:hypothetical protein
LRRRQPTTARTTPKGPPASPRCPMSKRRTPITAWSFLLPDAPIAASPTRTPPARRTCAAAPIRNLPSPPPACAYRHTSATTAGLQTRASTRGGRAASHQRPAAHESAAGSRDHDNERERPQPE